MPYGFSEGNEVDKDEYFSRPSIQSAEKDFDINSWMQTGRRAARVACQPFLNLTLINTCNHSQNDLTVAIPVRLSPCKLRLHGGMCR
jgi:hypothetical protein